MQYEGRSPHFAVIVWAAIAILTACSGGGESSAPSTGGIRTSTQPVTTGTADIPPESGGPTELVIRWGTLPYNSAIAGDTPIAAEVENTSPDALTATLVLVSAGLDGRSVRHELTKLTVPGRTKLGAAFAAKDFPIQSATSTAFVVAQVEYTSQGTSKVVPSKPVYYRFATGYGSVTLRPVEEVGITANDGQAASEGTAPSGLLWSNGSFGELAPGATYGQTGFFARSSDAATPLASSTESVVQPSGVTSNISIKVCTTWHVQFIDSALGEDVWPTANWQDVAASLAHAVLLTVPGNGIVWQGQLDWQGCMPSSVSVPPGTYRMQHSTTGIGSSPYVYNVYYMSGGTEYGYDVSADFTASSSTTYTVHPSFNNDAIQASAVAGQIIATHILGSLGGADLGMVGGTYKIHANEGCPSDPYGGSCYSPPPADVVHVGTFVNNGYTEGHWKYVIAHEFGHQAQNRAMGAPSLNYNDSPSQVGCQCTFDPGYGNAHCLQSREYQGAAEIEGFAQGFASRIFNSASQQNGSLNYYKPFLQDNGQWIYPPMQRDTYSAQRWMELHCSTSDRGVEWDWSTFVFNVSNISSTNQTKFSDLFNIYKAACGFANCSGNDIGFPELDFMAYAAYGGDAHYTRFDTTGNAHGINH